MFSSILPQVELDDFKFPIISSDIPSAPPYEVYISPKMIIYHIARACLHFTDFIYSFNRGIRKKETTYI